MNQKVLESTITKYAQLYYEGRPEVSDEYFDSLTDQLSKEYPDSEILKTPGWGYNPESRKTNHLYGKVEGISYKTRSFEGIPDKYLTDVRVSAKLDGLSVVLYYADGKLVKAVTRGNGYEGLDITDKIPRLANGSEFVGDNKFRLFTSLTGAVRGEILITNSSWDSMKRDLSITDPSANQRNYAAGIINRKDLAPELSYLNCIVYKIVADEGQIVNVSTDSLVYNVPYETFIRGKVVTEEDLKRLYDKYREVLPCDGLVLTKHIGVLNDSHEIIYDEIARKFESESKEVVVTNITWEHTRTGRIVPRIWFDPVELSGAVVRKCTGINAKFISDSGIGKGSVIEVFRANEVIPNVKRVIKRSVPDLPKVCPHCGLSLIWDHKDLVCPESDQSQIPYRFISVVGETEGASYATYQSIIDNFGIHSLEDLADFLGHIVYNINLVEDLWSGDYTINLVKSIIRKLTLTNSVRAIVSMNVAGIGWKTAQSIVETYPEFVRDVFEDKEDEVLSKVWNIKGIGDSTYNSIKDSLIPRLSVFAGRLTIIDDNDNKVETKYSVAITGSLSVKRDEFIRMIEDYGISVSSNFKEIKYLITNNPESTSSKMKKAKDNGVEIISESEFIKILKGEI